MSRLKKLTGHVLVCEHKTCHKQGGRSSAKELKHALRESSLHKHVLVTEVDCLDQCGRGPVMVVYPEGIWYGDVDEECAREIVEQHLKKGKIIARKVLHDMRGGEAEAE